MSVSGSKPIDSMPRLLEKGGRADAEPGSKRVKASNGDKVTSLKNRLIQGKDGLGRLVTRSKAKADDSSALEVNASVPGKKENVEKKENVGKKETDGLKAFERLRDAMRALDAGRVDDAQKEMAKASKMLMAIAKTQSDPDFVSTFCRSSLTSNLTKLDDNTIVNMERGLDRVTEQATDDPVLAQMNFSVKLELLARTVRLTEEDGIDYGKKDENVLAKLYEAPLRRLKDLVGTLVTLAKNSPSLQAELAGKKIPLSKLKAIQGHAIKACKAFEEGKRDAIALLQKPRSIPVGKMPHAEFRKLKDAADLVVRAAPKDPRDLTDTFPSTVFLDSLKRQIDARIDTAQLSLKQLDPKSLENASRDGIEQLVSHVAIGLSVVQDPGELALLGLISKRLADWAMADAVDAVNAAAVADAEADAKNTAAVAAVANATDAIPARPTTKSKNKAELAAAAAAKTLRAKIAAADTYARTKKEADDANRIAADAVSVMDQVTAALARS